MTEYFSPLRYPGGKGKLVPFFERLIIDNGLSDGVYIEPYVGGGAVALSLLLKEYVSRIVINDKDRSLFAFWYSILHHSEELCLLIADTPVNMDTWHTMRDIQNHKEDVDLLSLGFSSFFLNRTNRSGILKAGVIGGYQQTGNYKINARYRKENLISRIRRIATYADRIELHNEDAVDLVADIAQTAPPDTLLYLDPPYYKKGQGLYMNYYNDFDHSQICDVISKVNALHWVVSYDNSAFIKDLYKDFRSQEFELNYSANNNGKGTEVMFFSDNCRLTEEMFNNLHIK